MARNTTNVAVGGRQLALSNLDKVLYPQAGFTKAAVIDYYVRVAPAILPHLRGRPVTLVRWPDGVEGESFFEKNCPASRPEWLPTVEVPSPGGRSGVVRYCLLEEVAALAWVANLAALELHTPLSARRVEPAESAPSRGGFAPTGVVFDLDPGPGAGVLDCARVAVELRSLLSQVSLEAVVKTSGSKGLHVALPLNSPRATFSATKTFAAAVAGLFAREFPDRVTDNMRKDLRHGRVLVDWSQNSPHKTTVTAYSLRGRPEPSVSTPVSWAEVEAALRAEDAGMLSFEATQVPARIDAHGDLFAPWLDLEQELPSLPA